MRQVLVDRARRRTARDRKEEALRLSFDGTGARFPNRWDDLLALDRALQRLDETDTRLHEVVELRFFGGLNEEEVADALGVSARTVRRDWMKARLFLHRELFPDGPDARHEA
jgi:RNA polymerase sigma factor (TIGR02999 family)